MHKVAIIGLGRMGSTIDDEAHFAVPYSVAAATKASDVLELVAGADLLPEKREDFNKRWGAAVYEDYRQMIDEEKPDLVAICTDACLPKPANNVADASARPDRSCCAAPTTRPHACFTTEAQLLSGFCCAAPTVVWYVV